MIVFLIILHLHNNSVFLSNNGKHVALKIIKSASHYMEAAKDEIVLLQQIAEGDKDNNHAVLHLVDDFELEGPNGTRLLNCF